jgi:lipopolysaccharide export system permease protein
MPLNLKTPNITTLYLIKSLLSVTVFVALSLSTVIWLTQSLKLLELIASSDAPQSLFIKLVALSLPRFLEIILPLSLVTAILFIYNKMIMDNEMIVMRACGFSQYALAKPALILACGMTLVLIFMTTWLSPRSYAEMHVLRQDIKTQYSSFLLREGVFNTFGNNLTVYLRAREKGGDLLGLMIHDRRDRDKPPATVIAKRGRIVMDGDAPNILVFDGSRQQMETDTRSISKLYFSRYTIEIKGLQEDSKERWREASERTLPELLNPDMTNRRDRNNKDLFLAEANNRMITPFNALSFALTSLACILLGPFNRRGQSRKVLLAAVTIVVLQSLNLLLVNLTKKSIGYVPFLALSTFAPLLVCALLLHERGEYWLMERLRGWRGKVAAA